MEIYETEEKEYVSLQDMNVIDNFMFNELTMQKNRENAIRFCRTILEPIIGTKIRKLELIPQKHQQGVTPKNHGIQMDVYIRAYTDECGELQQDVKLRVEPAIYDLEPNKYRKTERDVLRRARYYHALIDQSILPSGQSYSMLQKVVVIFIMPYDPFGYDRMLYTVKRCCVEEPDMPYEDGDYTFFLYAYGTKDIPSQELKDMLLFLVDSSEENAKNEDLRAVRTMMNEIKSNSEIGVKHMIAMEHDRDILVHGFERGMERGRQQGVKLTKAILRFVQEGYEVGEIAEKLQISEDEVRQIIEE